MKCSPLFLTSPTGVWKESFRLWLNKQNIQEPLSCLNPLSGKESFRHLLDKDLSPSDLTQS